jgi:hypothetical protein
MTSVIGSQHQAVVVQPTNRPQVLSETASPGKSGQSVGHLAKASVLEANDGEPGAQGRAASRIARMDVTVLPPAGSGDSAVSTTGTDGGEGATGQELEAGSVG